MKGPRPTGLCWFQTRRLIWTLVGSFGPPEKGVVSLKQGHAGRKVKRTLPLQGAERTGEK